MRASPPVDEPTPQGEVLAAAPQEAPAAAPPLVAPFDPPECEATAAPADALDALVTPGNVHRYLAYLSWHWAIRAVHLVEERIVEARRIGGATAARGEVRVLACLGSDEECASLQARWEGGDFVRVLRGQRLDRAEGEDVLPSSASELEALLRESALLEVPTRASRRPMCWRTGCGTYDVRSDRGDTTRAWILPHVGLAASSVGDYSPETGDGTAVTRVLVAWSLRTPVPSACPEHVRRDARGGSRCRRAK